MPPVYEGARPHAPSRIGKWLYFYDENGNTVRKERRKGEWPHHHFPGCGRCDEYFWDEENRLIKAEVEGKTTYFLYDAAGERTVKRGPHGETVYVSEYFQLQNRQQATKHVFVGTTRIVSKLAHFHPLYNPYDAWYERWNTYTYHSDHLGSSNFITDPAGREFEHIEYPLWRDLDRRGKEQERHRLPVHQQGFLPSSNKAAIRLHRRSLAGHDRRAERGEAVFGADRFQEGGDGLSPSAGGLSTAERRPPGKHGGTRIAKGMKTARKRLPVADISLPPCQ